MKYLVLLFALIVGAPASAQFANKHPEGVAMPAAAAGANDLMRGGPVAIGQVMAQADSAGRVAIIQAPAPAATGGLLDLSSFGWLQPYVTATVQALIAFCFTLWGKGKYSSMMDAAGRDALEKFLQGRANSLIADGFVSLSGKTLKVDNAALFREAKLAETLIPKALQRFGLSPEVVAAKIVDAIPQTTVGAAALVNAHVALANGSAGGPDPTFLPPTAPAA
jgi:hypothetical protein